MTLTQKFKEPKLKEPKLKDPVSSLTHLLGAVLAVPCTISLINASLDINSLRHTIAFAIFGAALILLYTASAVYHGVVTTEKISKTLRKIDHMMIFVLIAGTYTPICLIPLRGIWGYSLLVAIWVMAFSGIILKAAWMGAPRWLSAAIYVVMGWAVVAAFYPLAASVSYGGVILLVLGGVLYTVGAVIYSLKRPPLPFKYFGYHEIFHLFVMAGSASHIIFMFKYVL